MKNQSISLKIIVVGKPFTGKTSFVKKWIGGHFNNSYKSTIVSDFSSKVIKHNNNIYTIQLWDIGGQDRNILLTKMFCKDCHGAIVLCEAEDIDSLQSTKEWLKLVHENIKLMDEVKLPILLIQNKSDLITNMVYNEDTMNLFCQENAIEKYFMASAKTGYNVNESMEYLLDDITEKLNHLPNAKKTNSSSSSNNNENNVSVLNKENEGIKSNRERGCC